LQVDRDLELLGLQRVAANSLLDLETVGGGFVAAQQTAG